MTSFFWGKKKQTEKEEGEKKGLRIFHLTKKKKKKRGFISCFPEAGGREGEEKGLRKGGSYLYKRGGGRDPFCHGFFPRGKKREKNKPGEGGGGKGKKHLDTARKKGKKGYCQPAGGEERGKKKKGHFRRGGVLLYLSKQVRGGGKKKRKKGKGVPVREVGWGGEGKRG